MHILLIHQSFAALNEPGGTRHHELARYLAERGHQVTVIASPVSYLTGAMTTKETVEEKQILGDGSVTILRTYTYSGLHTSFFHRVFSFLSFMISSFLAGLRVKEVDLVWGTSPPIFQGVTAWALARLKRVPFLFEVRDLWPAFAVAVGILRQPLLIRLAEWLERFLYRHADRVMVNSPGFIEHVRRRGARRVELVPNGADPRMFDPFSAGATFRQQNGLEGKFVALYAGAHGISNDLEVVLAAAKLLLERREINFVLLGAGKEKAALIETAQEFHLENVHFLPSVPKTAMAEALAAADACIAILKPVPLYATVYPNKVFDYMAAGRAVILAIDGVIRQVVEEARAGVFVQPGDASALAEAVVRLAEHREAARAMGVRGREHIQENFDRAQMAEKLMRIMLDMVGHN
ncbi:MAG: glycosyltransferase family 4 protein [Anaerolineales bacterium]